MTLEFQLFSHSPVQLVYSRFSHPIKPNKLSVNSGISISWIECQKREGLKTTNMTNHLENTRFRATLHIQLHYFLLCLNTVRLDLLLVIINKERRDSESVMSSELLFMFVWNKFVHKILLAFRGLKWTVRKWTWNNLQLPFASWSHLPQERYKDESYLKWQHLSRRKKTSWHLNVHGARPMKLEKYIKYT